MARLKNTEQTINRIKSALNLSFAVFIIYVLSCSKPVSYLQKEETTQPPPFLKKERNHTRNDSLWFAKASKLSEPEQTLTKLDKL